MAGPFGSRIVPIAREPSAFFTLVATRTYSSPAFTKSVAVPPFSFTTSSTKSKLLFIFVVPKYKAGTSLPATASGAFDPRGAQLGCLRLERRHRGPHFVQLSGRKARQQCRSCDKESGAKDAYDERFSIDEVIPIHVTSLPQR